MSLTLLAPLIAAGLLGSAALALQVQRGRQAQLIGRVIAPRAPAGSAMQPAVLYFTGAACTICHTAQTPALARLADDLGGSAVIQEVDVADKPDLARRYRVMSLPTTVVLAADGTVAAVNVGFASADRIREQLTAAGLRAAA
jgi:thioredoxin-like negative regulator of GroEL